MAIKVFVVALDAHDLKNGEHYCLTYKQTVAEGLALIKELTEGIEDKIGFIEIKNDNH